MSHATENFLLGEEGNDSTLETAAAAVEPICPAILSRPPSKEAFEFQHRLEALLLEPDDDAKAVQNAQSHVLPRIARRAQKAAHAGYYLLQDFYQIGLVIRRADVHRQALLLEVIGDKYIRGNIWRSVAHSGAGDIENYEKGSIERKNALNNLYRKEHVLKAADALSLPPNSLAETLKRFGAKRIIQDAADKRNAQALNPSQGLVVQAQKPNSKSALTLGETLERLLLGKIACEWRQERGRLLTVIDRDDAGSKAVAFLPAPKLYGLCEFAIIKLLEKFVEDTRKEESERREIDETADQLDLFESVS